MACGAETTVSDAFAASMGAARKAAFAKMLARATPLRIIRRSFTAHSILVWVGQSVTAMVTENHRTRSVTTRLLAVFKLADLRK
jgi:hypothetical protein